MPTITINDATYEFQQGQTILEVALEHEIEVPHYCWHPSLSVVANCRICLAEVHAPNPRNEGKVEFIGKLVPTCQTPAADGQVVWTHSPRSIANQKAVMEYLLINHPVDCAICDQAGECHLQDYSYQYGRGQARFQEQKIKQPKKDLGPNVLLYADRCIMCTRCVRFTREVTGTAELIVEGRGAMEQIDVFPGMALDNELSANVIDLCPVGALLDKDFLFQQRVWYLTKTPSIDGITASGDNVSIEHNKGRVYRLKPRPNLEVNRYWITDEVRYGWHFVHDEQRLRMPVVRSGDGTDAPTPRPDHEAPEAWSEAADRALAGLSDAGGIAALISPMLSCEDAFLLGRLVRSIDPDAVLGVGPVPVQGEDKTFLDGFTMYAEKAPNARGVRRVLTALTGAAPLEHDAFVDRLGSGGVQGVVLTGNYPSQWTTDALIRATASMFTLLIDTLPTPLTERADVVLPGATWVEKSGTFENANNRLQTFERAIEPIDYVKSEAQIALDLMARMTGESTERFNAANVRQAMAADDGLTAFATEVHMPRGEEVAVSDMELVEI